MKRPAVLIHAPSGQGWVAGVDVEFLKELRMAGLEVDYTDAHTEFTWDRTSIIDNTSTSAGDEPFFIKGVEGKPFRITGITFKGWDGEHYESVKGRVP